MKNESFHSRRTSLLSFSQCSLPKPSASSLRITFAPLESLLRPSWLPIGNLPGAPACRLLGELLASSWRRGAPTSCPRAPQELPEGSADADWDHFDTLEPYFLSFCAGLDMRILVTVGRVMRRRRCQSTADKDEADDADYKTIGR